MPCVDCEKKKIGNISPDVWKDGARNTTDSGGRTGKTTNMLLNRHKSAYRMNPYGSRCLGCKGPTMGTNHKYCSRCAFDKGVCSDCGKKIFDTKFTGSINANYRK
eukprot:TRINITY_DN55980_c0_g1_i1.p1 TRINITY_DN55980_c0_g1~~TRINITY_DN55980_c0_g1_i1.p1  ORF type:complete len:105 (-),score=13.64 TRINITY_DN55980_c0_g1_i1:21-335(-)